MVILAFLAGALAGVVVTIGALAYAMHRWVTTAEDARA